MATISYQLRPAYASNYGGGTLFVDNLRTLDVKAALTAGNGTIVADVADSTLIWALDNYGPLYRADTSPVTPPPPVTRREYLVVERSDPAPGGEVPILNPDGVWSATPNYADAITTMVVKNTEAPSTDLLALRAYFAAKYGTLGPTAPTFTPTDLTGLTAWWKADGLALADGASVASWPDVSGNTHTLTQVTGGLQPVYHTAQQNGLPALTFDGTNDYLATAAFASPTAGCSVFAVQNLAVLDAYRTILCHAAAATWTAPYARVLLRVSDTSGGKNWQFLVEDASDPANLAQEVGVFAPNAWNVTSCIYDQTTESLYRDGTQVGTQAKAGVLTSSTRPVFVGADTSLSDNWKGQVGEIIYYDRGLSSTERDQVTTYLLDRWGL